VIATNTSTRIVTASVKAAAREGGGVSGAPLAGRSLETLGLLRQRLGPAFPIISVGGIMSAEDVLLRLASGANLVQIYTGLVYRGPALLAETMQMLAA
jgi:dihydroorotate dehydrogenase